MKKVYPVFLTKTDTVVLVEVPDLEILTEANDLENAIDMARDAIGLKCVSMEDKGEAVAEPTDIAKLDANEGTFAAEGRTFISLVDIDTVVYRKKTDTRTIRRNVSLPAWLDYEAERAKLNVSQVLRDALMSELKISKY